MHWFISSLFNSAIHQASIEHVRAAVCQTACEAPREQTVVEWGRLSSGWGRPEFQALLPAGVKIVLTLLFIVATLLHTLTLSKVSTRPCAEPENQAGQEVQET